MTLARRRRRISHSPSPPNRWRTYALAPTVNARRLGMRKRLLPSLLLLALAVTVALPLQAEAKKAATKDPFDPKALAVFEKTCKFMAGLKGYSLRAETLVDLVYRNGPKVQIARNMDITVQRPNAFKVVTKGDDVSATSVFDGKTFILAFDDKKVYGQISAAMDIDAVVAMLDEKYALDSPLSDFIVSDACSGLHAQSASYLGLGYVGDTLCHHLIFQSVEIDWQIWIEDGPKPLPRKVLITEKKLSKAPQFLAFLNHWQIVDNPPAEFAYTAPKGYERDGNLFTKRPWKR
jgi:hypothetical protein